MRSSARQAIACIFAIICIVVTANSQNIPVKEPGGTITGKVTVKGRGAPGITVVLLPSPQMTRREYTGPKAVTDNDGNYRIANVTPGSYRVIPVAKVYVPAENADSQKVLIVNKGDTIEHIDFAMIRGAVITGKVLDAEGRPVVEEGVSVFTDSENRNYAGSYSTTDDRGVYRIYGLRAGSYRVAAGRDESMSGAVRPHSRTYHPSASDPAQATVVELSEGGEAKDVDITFTRRVSTYTARGRIIDGDTGQPLANVDYGITRIEKNGGSSSRTGGYRTNSRGEFKVENLSPGTYSIPVSTGSDNDLRFEETPFEIVDQDVNGLVVKGNRGGSISGVVVFEGVDDSKTREQFDHWWVMASVEGIPGQSKFTSGKIASDGSFHIRGLAGGGALTLSIHSKREVRIERIERDGVPQTGRIVLQEREHIKGLRVIAQLGNGSLRGRIEVVNGTLPADARFSLSARIVGQDLGRRFSGVNMMPQVDARGQFIVEGLMAGTYDVDAGVYFPSAKLGYIGRKQVVITQGGTTTVNITVDLSSTPIRQ
ncbi:MAG TPA: carboxypeptidase regulatory-like domain-containing protein [Pyrinomonadaceae bacterium]|nr:carboxypeptidase regulatory-like domain-containing protein [Pyrinomonadaceae bacterium]